MTGRHPPRVLVIDDGPSVREVVRYLLAAFGYECQTAADGPSGLARFAASQTPHLLLISSP